MQLSPKSAIPVSYTASIPGDTTLYYVQAVLRDTATSAILQTLNLTRQSVTPNRYVGSFNPVSDPSGLGRPVDVTISVFEDAGHTTLSTNYQILQLAYVVLQPFIANLGNGGGGSNVSYEKIAATVIAALDTKSTKDAEKKLLEAIHAIPLAEFDYERMENTLSQISLQSETRQADRIAGTHRDLMGGIEGVKAHAEEVLGRHGETVVGRLDHIERVLGSVEQVFKELVSEVEKSVTGEMKDSIGKEGERVVSKLIETIHSALAGAAQSDIMGGMTDKLLKTVGDREVHLHMGGSMQKKESKQNGPGEDGFDPTKILAELT